MRPSFGVKSAWATWTGAHPAHKVVAKRVGDGGVVARDSDVVMLDDGHYVRNPKRNRNGQKYGKPTDNSFLILWKMPATIRCAWPHVVQKPPEV